MVTSVSHAYAIIVTGQTNPGDEFDSSETVAVYSERYAAEWDLNQYYETGEYNPNWARHHIYNISIVTLEEVPAISQKSWW